MKLLRVVDLVSHQLKQLGVEAGECWLSESSGFSVSARQCEVESVEHHLENAFSVRVYHQQCVGSASCSDFSEESLRMTIQKAMNIAQFSSADPYAGLADRARLAYQKVNCDLYHPWELSVQEAIQKAITCEHHALQMDQRIQQSDGAHVSTMHSHQVYLNTLDFVGDYRVSEHAISCGVIASDGHVMQRDDEYTVARNPRDLRSIDFIAEKAAQKTVSRLQARKIKTQTCPVIFEASVAKSLIGSFVAAISGGNLYRHTSFLLNALGKPVFPAWMNIYQQPHLLSAMGSCPFDQDGVATVDQHYIQQGELVRYALGSYSARKLGMETTGNSGGIFNLSISHQQRNQNDAVTLDQLIKKMHQGLLVTELMGQGVNITTGDYSRGACGFWIENGEIQFPVEEITIAGNLKDMLLGVVDFANDIDTRGTIRTGSILIDKMTIAGS